MFDAHFHCSYLFLLGLLSTNSGILPDTLPPQTRLLPRADGPQHPAAGSEEGRHEETGFLPSS